MERDQIRPEMVSGGRGQAGGMLEGASWDALEVKGDGEKRRCPEWGCWWSVGQIPQLPRQGGSDPGGEGVAW